MHSIGDPDGLARLSVRDIDAHVQQRCKGLRRRTIESYTVYLRSFLRYLQGSGRTPLDLSRTVIGPRIYDHEHIPSALRPEEVQAVLEVARQDFSATGRRDYAFLMLLATYGLRAGEVVALRLDDIDWKREILRVLHSKTGADSELPLLPEPGEAVLRYLEKARPESKHREVFLHMQAGLRLGEIVALTLADVSLQDGTIEVRETKFFKHRRLPLAVGVIAAVKDYLVARQHAGAPTNSGSALFWNQRLGQRYSYGGVGILLAEILRRAGLKPSRGRIGPRIHDLRHTMVGHRMRDWYKEGINPQSKLPHLATYLGHKDITSTLVYMNITPELLHEASERPRGTLWKRQENPSLPVVA